MNDNNNDTVQSPVESEVMQPEPTAVSLLPVIEEPPVIVSRRPIICKPEVLYRIARTRGERTKIFTFSLPTGSNECTVRFGFDNNMWIGRDGHVLRAHICFSAEGVVVLQPTDDGWIANVYDKGYVTIGC